jgi:hypothetical protein
MTAPTLIMDSLAIVVVVTVVVMAQIITHEHKTVN